MKENRGTKYYLETNVSPQGFSYKADKPTKGEILGLGVLILGSLAKVIITGIIATQLKNK